MLLFRYLFIFAALMIASSESFAMAEAAPEEKTPVITESFTYKNSYYLTLSDGSRFALKAAVIEKAGWFSSAKYGNPAAHWTINDRVAIKSAEGFEFPFLLVNLETEEEARAAYYNPHMEGIENIHTMFQEVMDTLQRQNVDFIRNELRDIKKVVDIIEGDRSVIQQLSSMIQKQNTELSALRKELNDIKNSVNAINNQPAAAAPASSASAYGGTTVR